MGKHQNKNYPSFGVEKFYAARINNKDSAVLKKDFYTQKGSGYRQTDLFQKFSYKISDSLVVTLNTQYSTSSDINRYDQLTDYKKGQLKWAEWYYGPQNRLLTSLSAQIDKKNNWFSTATLLLSFQKIDEDRISRKFNEADQITRNEGVTVYGFNADFNKKKHLSDWFYGVELIHNKVTSSAFSKNIISDIKTAAQTRYPDGNSTLSSAGAYLSYKKQFTEKAIYSLGTRYSFSVLNSTFIDTTFIQLPFSNIKLNNGALTGNAGLVYSPNASWKINAGLSTAYRSPNVDDVGKVFAKRDFVLVPNDQLQSELAYNAEIGITKSFFNEKLKINTLGFYTLLKNAIIRDFYQLNGQDSIFYEGDLLPIQANVNTAEATVYGASLSLLAEISPHWSLKSNLNYTLGKNTTAQIPLGHIPPLYSRTDITFQTKKLTLNFYAKYQAWKKIKEYSPSGEDNEDKATIDGTPPWQTYNLSSSINLNTHFMLQLAVENILDKHYRPFASGISAPGRNFIITLRGNF